MMPKFGVVDPLPDIGRRNGADDPGNDQDGAQHRAAGEIAVQRKSAEPSPARRRDPSVEAKVQITVFSVTCQNTSLLRIERVVVDTDKDLVAQLQARRRVEERQFDRVVDRVGDDDEHHHDGRQARRDSRRALIQASAAARRNARGGRSRGSLMARRVAMVIGPAFHCQGNGPAARGAAGRFRCGRRLELAAAHDESLTFLAASSAACSTVIAPVSAFCSMSGMMMFMISGVCGSVGNGMP